LKFLIFVFAQDRFHHRRGAVLVYRVHLLHFVAAANVTLVSLPGNASSHAPLLDDPLERAVAKAPTCNAHSQPRAIQIPSHQVLNF
jgi:hypothetical protein